MRHSEKHQRLTALLVATLWCLVSLTAGPGMAASNLVAPTDYDDVGRAEKVFFGHVDTTSTYLRRLDQLETGIFGRVRSGSQEKRLQRIATALGLTTAAGTSPEAENKQTVKKDAVGKDAAVAPAKNGKQVAINGEPVANTFNDTTTGNPSLTELMNAAAGAAPTVGTTGSASGKTVAADTNSTPVVAKDSPETESSKSGAKTETAKIGIENADAAKDHTAKIVSSKPDTAKGDSAKNTAETNIAKTVSKAPAATAAGTAGKAAKATKPLVVLGKETPKTAPLPEHAQAGGKAVDRRLERPSVVSQNAPLSKDKEIDSLFRQGMAAFRDRRNKEAQTCFKQILAIDPRNVDAYFNLGSMAEANHDYLDALTFYRAALASNPSDKDLKKAVGSMENELLKQRTKTASGIGSHRYTAPVDPARNSNVPTANAPMNSVPVVPVGQSTAPVTDIATTEAPTIPAQQIDPNTFSLQTAQNGTSVPYTPLNAINAPYQPVPVWNVPPTLTGSVPANNFPVRNISPTNPNRNSFGYIIRAGAGIALSGSGLHCPICRVMGGLH